MKKLFIIAISSLATHISFGQFNIPAWPANTISNNTQAGFIGIGTRSTSGPTTTPLPNFNLHMHGTVDFIGPPDRFGNPGVNFGKTTRLGFTNTTTGMLNTDGVEFRMSENNFSIENRENGNLTIGVSNTSLTFSQPSSRIWVGTGSNILSVDNARMNIIAPTSDNGLFIQTSGTKYALGLKTSVNTTEALIVRDASNVSNFSVKGNGDVTSGNIAVSSPATSDAIKVSTVGNSNVSFRVTNEGEVFSKTESTEKQNIISNPNSDALVVTTAGNSSPKFKVNNNGEVTSGNTYILGTLRVVNANGNQFSVDNAGYVRAREIKVNLLEIPDYVFKSDYKLMSLKELEQYISLNKHLPNIKSELEYKNENGIEIGELNMKLLEKVEELTLYIIDLQKQIEAINKKQ